MARFERDLELHNVRRAIFDTDEVRLWERRSLALDHVGDGLFLLFARDHAPLAERLDAIAGRLEAVADLPRGDEDPGDRPAGPPLARRSRSRPPRRCRSFFDEIVAAGDGRPAADRAATALAGRERLGQGRRRAVRIAGCEGTLADGSDDWAIGRERHDELVGLRAFDGLDADAILALGWERLAEERARARRPLARSTPTSDEAAVIDRVKADRPADFDGALDAYRDAMLRARAHLIEHDLVTVPDDERIDVIATPEYLRNVIPFAAYFEPADVRPRPEGHLHRHPVGAHTTRTRCASTTTPRSATPASTRRTRATISSWTPHGATRR